MPTLVTSDGVEIPELTLRPKMLIGRTISLYGPSKSGKTAITKHVLDLLRPYIDQVLLVSPTEPANQSFRKYIPQQLIHYEMSSPDPKNPHRKLSGMAGVLGFLKRIWKRQEMLTQTYKRANEPKVLESLFRRLPAGERAKGDADIAKAADIFRVAVERVRKRFKHDPDRFKGERESMEEKFDELRSQVHKKYILANVDALWVLSEQDGLTETEQWAVQYCSLNPNLVLIFDDCAAGFSAALQKREEFLQLFYQNRHVNLTVIFTFQDDTDLATNLRKNSFISIYCNEIVCNANFERKANNISKADTAHVRSIAPKIYEAKYRKLAYVRDDDAGHFFYHFTAPRAQNKMFGSDALLELCRGVAAEGGGADCDNPFYEQFRLN